MKYAFRDDYSEGCHPNILEALARVNLKQCQAYGHDEDSATARALICNKMERKNTPIFFITGGTLSNLLIHTRVLHAHEAVIAPSSGHIHTSEAGAIEATGHKIISADAERGKLTAATLQETIDANQRFPHVGRPRLVYISNATEVGTVYTKAELKALSDICRASRLYLMLDGARLGTALTSDNSDLTLQDIAELTDIFWIGGTKCGAMFGEAIVIPNQTLAEDFEILLKQRGALLAKGRSLGVQFKELFTDNLYFELANRANGMAKKISDGITSAGHELPLDCDANMLLPILPNDVIARLEQSFDFYPWAKVDDNLTQVRIVTSWATDEAQVDRFISELGV